MKTIRYSLVLLVLSMAAQLTTAQSVVIKPNKVVYTRTAPISEYKKTFEITWPKVKAATPTISKKIEMILNYEKLFDFTVAEEKSEIQWLEEASYEVGYNDKNALSIELSIQGSGAYPSGVTKHLVINTATGTRATSATEFTNTAKLISKLNSVLKSEIAASLKEIKADKENGDIVPEELFEGKSFTAGDLKEFSIDADGITFHYAYNFVHAVKALEPIGEFKMSWAEIKPYLRRGGLLASIAR